MYILFSTLFLEDTVLSPFFPSQRSFDHRHKSYFLGLLLCSVCVCSVQSHWNYWKCVVCHGTCMKVEDSYSCLYVCGTGHVHALWGQKAAEGVFSFRLWILEVDLTSLGLASCVFTPWVSCVVCFKIRKCGSSDFIFVKLFWLPNRLHLF